jgi:exo-1,4-beta-D-glucosaminidase
MVTGLLLMVGWSCHWEWSLTWVAVDRSMAALSAEDINFISNSFRDQVLWLRNNPVFLSGPGSDLVPSPNWKREYQATLKEWIRTGLFSTPPELRSVLFPVRQASK